MNSTTKVSLIIWIICCSMFAVATIFSQTNSPTFMAATTLFAVPIGAVTFLAMWVSAIQQKQKGLLSSVSLYSVGVFLFLIVLPILILNLQPDYSTQKSTSASQDLIDCYVDGVPIKATRSNCAELSKKKEPQVVVQQPKPYVQVAPPPKIEPIDNRVECTKCDTNYFGKVVCKTYKAYVCY